MTSETGWLSTEATVSRASAWSAESRMVIAFEGFMIDIMPQGFVGCQTVWLCGIVVANLRRRTN